MNRLAIIQSVAALALFAASPVVAQTPRDFSHHEELLRREQPATYDLIVRLDRIQGLLLGALAEEGETVRASAEKLPDPNFEFDMLDRLGMLTSAEGRLDDLARESDAGYAQLGSQAAGIIEWTNHFRRGVLGILADPTIDTRDARREALRQAVAIYRSRPEFALPTMPKNMDVLYDHPYALDFRTGYTDLDGLIWAGHWFKLAASKPLLDLTGAELAAGVDTVHARYYSKLTYGEPPEFFPSELPLAPTIAADVSYLSPETTAIWDNQTMMEEVLADILASPRVTDRQGSIDAAVAFFMDPKLEVVDPVEFAAMALRHGIFFQGGFPLVLMLQSERNAGGHADHGGGNVVFPGMP